MTRQLDEYDLPPIGGRVYNHPCDSLPTRFPHEITKLTITNLDIPDEVIDQLRAYYCGASLRDIARWLLRETLIGEGLLRDDLPLDVLDDMLEFSGIEVEES